MLATRKRNEGSPKYKESSRMLENLVHTIEEVQNRWKGYGARIGANELRTRVILIDPVLKALGWDPSDPSRVEIEPKIGGMGWADYALLDSSGHRLCFIEAKKANDLKPANLQTAAYTFTYNTNTDSSRVLYCAWTNGISWVVWDVLSGGERVIEVSIDSKPVECAYRLLGLWHDSFKDRVLRNPSSFSSHSVETVELEHSNDVLNGYEWVDLNSPDLRITGYPSPKSIRFPDDTEKDIKAWRGLFGETAAWLWTRGYLTWDLARERFPKWFGEGTTKFSGKPMTILVQTQDLPISYEGCMSAAESVKRTKRLLAGLSVTDTVYVLLPERND